MISSELPEILRMSHRIVVMSEGRVTGTLDAGEATQESVMHYATLRPDENPEDAAELGLAEPALARNGRRRHERVRGHRAAPRSTSSPAACGTGSQQFLAFASLIAIFLFFSIASSNFLNYANVTAILFSTVVIGLLALGTTFVIITGGIDLSIGTGMTLCAVISGVLIVNDRRARPGRRHRHDAVRRPDRPRQRVQRLDPRHPAVHRDAGDDAGGQGLALVISDSTPIYFTDSPSYTQISTGHLFGVNFPNAVLVLAWPTSIAAVVLNKTILGRYTYSIGCNEEATALSGISVRRWKIVIYTLAGLFTAWPA